VRTKFHDIEQLLIAEGVISRRKHPELDASLRYLLGRGDLARVLPGIYAQTTTASSTRIRVQALMASDPDAVLTEATAASVSFWPEIAVDAVTCAVRHRREPQPGFRFSRRTIPAELIIERSGLRFTSPALTALDLCATHGGEAIDHALRSRRTTLKHLHRAMELTAARVGNPHRRALLLDSRDEPWSAAERHFHRLLRSAGFVGWRANQPVLIEGATYFADVLFAKIRVVIEIDGREHHIGSEVFETDRWRQNLLILDGWCVLRFTWRMIQERPGEVVAMIRKALAIASAA
jgi:very-short-patch-repair endonuclease